MLHLLRSYYFVDLLQAQFCSVLETLHFTVGYLLTTKEHIHILSNVVQKQYIMMTRYLLIKYMFRFP